MILDSITIENFGAYGGTQTAILTPEEDKPIVLFGGMNGGGKTTLLDAVQLAFYGAKAKLSNRGGLSYRDYLTQSIHRGATNDCHAKIALRFRRVANGETRHFELERSWFSGGKGVEESLKVLMDGVADPILTDQWEETAEAYLPSGISHLFFFDGEQIKELAEGGHAAEILGTAVYSLLGLDLVDRLDADLVVFERRKKGESLDPAAAHELGQAKGEVEQIDKAQEAAAVEEGAMVNECGRLAKEVRDKEVEFRTEGGDLYLRRHELEEQLGALKARKKEAEKQLRELAAGPLPLTILKSMLGDIERRARDEVEVLRARALASGLEARDKEVLSLLRKEHLPTGPMKVVEKTLEADRRQRKTLSKAALILNANESLAPSVAYVRTAVLPADETQARRLRAGLAELEEAIVRLESDLARVPPEDRIAAVQAALAAARLRHTAKLAELEEIRVRKHTLQRQRELAESRLDRLGEVHLDARFAEDDRQRMLRHSKRVRDTLRKFQSSIVQRHAARLEQLMLDSFRKLLRKSELVTSLRIDPRSFEATLIDRKGNELPFDRLSAGERQLLATSLLWGLAQASGRPVPTIIDTPLGRLDSSHRRNLVERYFPFASHQVLLLSTDEEIVGPYLKALRPYIARTYLLEHDEAKGRTFISPGYFE